MERLSFTINRLHPSVRLPRFISRHHQSSRNLACVYLAVIGTGLTARAGEFMTDGPGSPRTTLFSWDEVPPSPDQQATAAGMSDESVFQSLLPDSASAREDFWDRDKKWAGIFKMNDFAEPSTYVEAVNAITRAHSGGLEPEMEWAAAPESMFALAGLSLGGVFLLRYTGMRRRSGFYFHDCGRGGGLSLCSVDFRPRGSAKRKPA